VINVDQEVKELKVITELASYINEDTKNVRQAAVKLAQEFENEFSNPSHPLKIEDMAQRYIHRDEMCYLNDTWSEEGFKQILATGAIPVDDKIKNKLLTIEYLYPQIAAIYQKFKYVDEVWYLDIQSVAGGNTQKNILSRIRPGFDIGGEFERGEKPYSRFGIIGPEQNPERKYRWSPDVFIELFDELVVSAQTPVFVKNDLVGKTSIHYNLSYLCEDTITDSPYNLLVISNELTLIGLSSRAQAITNFSPYQKKTWDSPKAKIEYVQHELNLGEQYPGFAAQLKTIKHGIPGKWEFAGQRYQIFKANIAEIGAQVLLLM
jgi:hypothetical protein